MVVVNGEMRHPLLVQTESLSDSVPCVCAHSPGLAFGLALAACGFSGASFF